MKITAYEMRAIGEPLVRVEREQRAPGPGEALVAVRGCGVCHTDLGFLFDGVPTRHPLPLVLGHEVAGVVVGAGSGAESWTGKSVIVPAVIPCGRCRLCAAGRGDICRAQVFPGNDDDGGFASHLIVPAHGLAAVTGALAEGATFAKLAVAADAVSTAYAAVRNSGLGPGDFAVVVGAGGVGGFVVQIARALGARVLAIDVDPARLELCRSHGAEWTLSARGALPKDLKKAVRDLAREHGVASQLWKLFEASGTAAGQETAFHLLCHGAALGIVGYHAGDVSVRLSNLMAFAARAEGTWGCPPEWFGAVLELVATGKVAIDPFAELHPMSSINDVLARLRRHELSRRPVLVPDFEVAR